jgi:cell shape-determining protein MreC
LIALYEEPEKPPNALEFVRIIWKYFLFLSFVRRFIATPSSVDIDAVLAENETLKRQNEELREQIEKLQAVQSE